MTVVVMVLRVLVGLLAITGIAVNLAISSDIKKNLRAAILLGKNQSLVETARIDIRGARASAGAHAMFLVLGLLALGSPVPLPGKILVLGHLIPRQLFTITFVILWDAIQLLVVMAQARNQLDRMRYRNSKNNIPGD